MRKRPKRRQRQSGRQPVIKTGDAANESGGQHLTPAEQERASLDRILKEMRPANRHAKVTRPSRYAGG
jgi:hypothetical protein